MPMNGPATRRTGQKASDTNSEGESNARNNPSAAKPAYFEMRQNIPNRGKFCVGGYEDNEGSIAGDLVARVFAVCSVGFSESVLLQEGHVSSFFGATRVEQCGQITISTMRSLVGSRP